MKDFIKNLMKSNWTKWHHVMFMQSFRAGIPIYELLCRVNRETGLTQYKRVRVGSCCHALKNDLDRTIFHPELVDGSENKGRLILKNNG